MMVMILQMMVMVLILQVMAIFVLHLEMKILCGSTQQKENVSSSTVILYDRGIGLYSWSCISYNNLKY